MEEMNTLIAEETEELMPEEFPAEELTEITDAAEEAPADPAAEDGELLAAADTSDAEAPAEETTTEETAAAEGTPDDTVVPAVETSRKKHHKAGLFIGIGATVVALGAISATLLLGRKKKNKNKKKIRK